MRLTQQQKGNVFHTGEKRKEGNEKRGERERGKEGGGTFPLFLSFLAYDVIGGERGVVGPPPLHTFVPTTLDQLAGCCSPSSLSWGPTWSCSLRGLLFRPRKECSRSISRGLSQPRRILALFLYEIVARCAIYLVKHANYVLGYL